MEANLQIVIYFSWADALTLTILAVVFVAVLVFWARVWIAVDRERIATDRKWGALRAKGWPNLPHYWPSPTKPPKEKTDVK